MKSVLSVTYTFAPSNLCLFGIKGVIKNPQKMRVEFIKKVELES
ncbi:hypothetical protein J2S19_002981 [Metabacillus malikii]|uniref:Uncharacterized protein n=1 Tax=Metabacillus malikii TaxID=1504265 RepID=A0ABT9ZIQ8_9BACI|nr:hypothetical protein [Metabacillus malikii]